MASDLRKRARRGPFARVGIDGARIDKPIINHKALAGTLSLTGPRVNEMTSNLDKALLERNGALTLKALDEIVHLVDILVEEMVDSEGSALQRLVWHSQIIRMITSRAQSAMQRMPDFLDLMRQSDYGSTLIQRILRSLAFYCDLTLQRASDREMTPEAWFKSEASLVRSRVNLGIAYFHVSRLMQGYGYEDSVALEERRKVFDDNFDIMFYALTYGPLEHETQSEDMIKLLKSHLEKASAFLDGPQPSINVDPAMYAIAKTQVLHVLTTIDRVREVLPTLSE